ncbi:hypothetical protein [Nocardia huaxiensis]|uniref:hypothetical protein n=1 Tax=Nocardia huaxiensis TaxID=2755382 RepID=UPI001E2E07F2|nr:hypothetical protein [Nocardia huaxiensis]UFS93909.1 hypothetical protein LPY97_24365 [Nocardia huaxiensis]
MTEKERQIHQESAKQDDRQVIPEPEVQDKHRDEARRMAETYRDDRPHTVLPGTDGTVAGTAVADWVDDEGNPVAERAEAKNTQE